MPLLWRHRPKRFLSSELHVFSATVLASITQIAILVCSKLAKICHDKGASLQQVNESSEVTMKRTCSKLAVNLLQIIAKTEYETQPGIELTTSRFRSGDANH
ncbi:hypothetical protein AVEN_230028-1 [Araneus ventricosus]|uniref:Uncharacterized protein n=1 Tax=Araneus ventricosus TaxID=182803 RepID=A0A4Y2CT03_ARAVE|nr:hypothetical protein AVEN_230028-1 [Araneus ventricosus]